MEPKRASEGDKSKRKMVRIKMKVKEEIIAKHENGRHVLDLALQYGMTESSINTTLKEKKDTITSITH